MTRRTGLAIAGALLLSAALGGVACRDALLHGFSARQKPSRIESFVATRLRRLAIGVAAGSATNPLQPTAATLAEGREHFEDHCALCHGRDGEGRTDINEGLYPPAGNLRAAATQQLTDADLLHVIRNGIRFTGMPGWGGDDDENWKLVLYIRHLAALSDADLAALRDAGASRGESHHHHSESASYAE